jgi:5-enolpyruvylshikimate-3-phosphate synthase
MGKEANSQGFLRQIKIEGSSKVNGKDSRSPTDFSGAAFFLIASEFVRSQGG